jgi:hypothetical protein
VILADAIIRHCGSCSVDRKGVNDGIEKALAEYEMDMFARGQELIRKSRMIEEVVYRDDGANALLRLFQTMSEDS